MRIALELWGADHDAVVATCLHAEREGIDAVYYGEAPGPLNLDCMTVLAHLAAVTDRIRLGPVIANALAGYRSPLLLAKQAATIAVASEGGSTCGSAPERRSPTAADGGRRTGSPTPTIGIDWPSSNASPAR